MKHYYYVIRTNDYAEQRIVGRHETYAEAWNEKRRRDRRDNVNSYRVIRSTRFEFIGTEAGEGVPIL